VRREGDSFKALPSEEGDGVDGARSTTDSTDDDEDDAISNESLMNKALRLFYGLCSKARLLTGVSLSVT
jgi:hypothetical protein